MIKNNIKLILACVTLAVFITGGYVITEEEKNSIRDYDFSTLLPSDPERIKPFIGEIIYKDLAGDGKEEAIVEYVTFKDLLSLYILTLKDNQPQIIFNRDFVRPKVTVGNESIIVETQSGGLDAPQNKGKPVYQWPYVNKEEIKWSEDSGLFQDLFVD